jgi:hypothetical protein
MKILPSKKTKFMATKTAAKKTGPKDRSYVNKTQKHEVKYESKRKSPAKQFGKGK